MQLKALPLVLGALVAQAGPSTRFHWDIPEPLEQVEVPGVVSANGLPMKLAAVRSRWSAERLLQYFATQFERAGLFIPPARDQIQRLKDPQLTALDPERMVSFTVILQRNPDGTTTVITGEAHLAERQASMQWIVPLFPGAAQPLQNVLEGLTTLTYVVAAPAKDVKAFYSEQLRHLGYREISPGHFQAPGRLLRLDVRPDGDKIRVVVLDGLPADQPMDPGAVK